MLLSLLRHAMFFFIFGDFGGALVFGRGTLYMKWRADLTRDDPTLRTSSGLERQRELSEPQPHIYLFSHNLVFSQFHYYIIT